MAEIGEIAFDQSVEIGLQPGHAFKLERMGHFVQGEPHPEVGLGQLHRLLDRPDIRFDIVELAGIDWLSAEQRQIILTEHLSRHISEQNADFRAEHRTVRG